VSGGPHHARVAKAGASIAGAAAQAPAGAGTTGGGPTEKGPSHEGTNSALLSTGLLSAATGHPWPPTTRVAATWRLLGPTHGLLLGLPPPASIPTNEPLPAWALVAW